jgi:prepilin-type N-terminal cleavage/methylation domain-containing protein
MISLNKNNKGFTIVELLIVIVVIGILALLVLTTYSGIQAKARNSKRQTDIASLQTHLEGFYSDNNGYYPSLTDMNNQAGFVKTQLNGTDPQAFLDPSHNPPTDFNLVANPVAKTYSYKVTQADGTTSCEADHTQCAKYTLTATYEGTVNGATTYVKNSLN